MDNCMVTQLPFPPCPWWLPQPTLFFSPFVSTLSNSIISQSLRQPCRKIKKNACKHLTPWHAREAQTMAGRVKTRDRKEARLKHIIHTVSHDRSKNTEQYTFDFICCFPLLPSASPSLINLLLSVHKHSLFFGEDQESEYKQTTYIHPGADNKQHRAPFERSDSILATLWAFMSGKSAVWTIWAS